jgi:hypothetical protein
MKGVFCILFFHFTVCVYAQQSQNMDSLSKVLEKIYYDDQCPRQQLAPIETKFGFQSVELDNQWKIINKLDSVNTIFVSEIIDKYGWLGNDQISDTANRTLFLVIQHADEKTQLKYLETLKNAARTGKAKPSDYALLLDRTNLKQGKFQEYGSQLSTSFSGKNVFDPIRDEPNVNKRRKSVGLPTMEEYSKFFNVTYILPEQDQYKNCYVLKGYVLDTTYKPIQNVSIYLGGKLVTKTDEDGYYLIALKKKLKTAKIQYSFQGFNDQVFTNVKDGEKDIYEKYVWLREKKVGQ